MEGGKIVSDLPKALTPFAMRRIALRQANLDYVHKKADELDDYLQKNELRILPEFDMEMRDVAVSLMGDGVSSYQTLLRHDPVLRALPDYTLIHILVPIPRVAILNERLQDKPYKDRVRIYPIDLGPPIQVGNQLRSKFSVITWMRDAFEVLEDSEGRVHLMQPLSYEPTQNLADPDNAYLSMLASEARLPVTVPLFYRGGNLMVVDRGQGRQILLVGSYEPIKNSLFYQESIQVPIPPAGFLATLKKITGVSEVIELPNTERLFHIDFGMTVLGPSTVGVLRPTDEKDASAEDLIALETYRRVLREQGITVLDIPTTSRRIATQQSPANAVQFTDRRDGKRKALVPYFGDVPPEMVEKLGGLETRIARVYRQAGVEPIWVRDLFYELQGNTHCMIMPFN